MNEEEMNGEVGYGFRPYDEELINHYLNKKIQGFHSEVDQSIAEVNFLKHEPWDLPAFSKQKSNDRFWYFFYQLDHKRKGFGRKTVAGYWKATGKDRNVRRRHTNKRIGIKKTLVFYQGRVSKKVKSVRTNWVMQEYHIISDLPNPKAYVICRLEEKANAKTSSSTPDEVGSSHQPSCLSPSDYGKYVALAHDEVESGRQLPSYIGNHVAEVDPPSQADLGAISDCDELDYDLFSELMAQLFEQDQDLPRDCNGIQTQFDITKSPLSNNLSSNCNGVQTQVDTADPEIDFALLDSYLNECEAYPEETVSHKKLVVESEGLNLNRGVIDMSLPHLPESLRGMSYIEDCHEAAIAQPIEAIGHVIATDLPTTKNSDANMSMKSSWNGQACNNHKSFSIFPNSPQLSHSSPQLSQQQRILMPI